MEVDDRCNSAPPKHTLKDSCLEDIWVLHNKEER